MRKKKIIYSFVVSAALSMTLVGCGTDRLVESVLESNTIESTESGLADEENTETTENTTTENTTTENITTEQNETFQMSDWLADNNYKVAKTGDFTYKGWSNECINDDKIPRVFEITGKCDYVEVNNGDGTKTIIASISQNPCTTSGGSWATVKGFSFVVDRYTGEGYTTTKYEREESYTVTLEDGRDVTIKIYTERIAEFVQFSDQMEIEKYTVTVPEDYDGLVLGWAPTSGFDKYGEKFVFSELPVFEGAEIFLWAK